MVCSDLLGPDRKRARHHRGDLTWTPAKRDPSATITISLRFTGSVKKLLDNDRVTIWVVTWLPGKRRRGESDHHRFEVASMKRRSI
jgi:hypothetical protein